MDKDPNDTVLLLPSDTIAAVLALIDDHRERLHRAKSARGNAIYTSVSSEHWKQHGGSHVNYLGTEELSVAIKECDRIRDSIVAYGKFIHEMVSESD